MEAILEGEADVRGGNVVSFVDAFREPLKKSSNPKKTKGPDKDPSL